MFATLLALLWFSATPFDSYAPDGAAFAVSGTAEPGGELPEGCYGLATAHRAGLEEWEPSVWTCEAPPEGTDALAGMDVVGGSYRPVLLRWDGWQWVRFADAPQPEALTRTVVRVTTTDATPALVWTSYASALIPQDGDGARMDARCVASSTAPLYSYQYTPWEEIVNPSTPPTPPQGPAIYWPTGRNVAVSPPAGNPFAGSLVWWSSSTWIEQVDLKVRGVTGATLNWVCEITVATTRPAP